MKQFSALNRDPKARYNHWRKKCEVGDCENGRKQRKREEYTEKKGTFFFVIWVTSFGEVEQGNTS
jgi:hypothetical protein